MDVWPPPPTDIVDFILLRGATDNVAVAAARGGEGALVPQFGAGLNSSFTHRDKIDLIAVL